MKPITYLLCVGLLCLWAPLFSQVTTTFSPASPQAPIGDSITLQLRVTGFTNITSVQFPIAYNSALLEFVSITNPALPDFSVANYFNQPAQNKISVSWLADQLSYPNGFTLSANSALFSITFRVKANGTSTVNLANLPPGIEFTNASGQNQTVNFQNGGVSVVGGNGPFQVFANTLFFNPGDTLCMPVTVRNFDLIVSMQYSLRWDTTVVKFVRTQGYGLPSLGVNNFNPNVPGSLGLGWNDPTTMGVSRADGDTIFMVCFRAVGKPGANTLVSFGDLVPGSPAEAANASGAVVWESTSGVRDTLFINSVRLSVDKDTVVVNQTVCSDVKVANFKKITSVQLGVAYNPAHLQFQSIQLGSNPLDAVLGSNFFTSNPGQIRFAWSDPLTTGVTLPDNATIFSICFTAIGPAGTVSPLPIQGFTTPTTFDVEVADSLNGPITPFLFNGSVTIVAQPPCKIDIANITNVSCNGGNNGAISTTPSGGSNYTFQWAGPGIVPGVNSTVQNPTGLTAGTYTVTVTSAGGCTATNTATVTGPTAIQSNFSVTNVTCNGGSDGAINITPTGGTPGYFFNWSGPSITPATQSNEDQTALKAGNYRVTITDTRGCQYISPQLQVSHPNGISLNGNPVVTPVSCAGAQNGSINITVTGGSGSGYTYMWSGPNGTTFNTEDLTGLAQGLYRVTVTDGKGCTSGSNISPINVPGPSGPITVTLSASTNVTCFGNTDGSATVTVNGGTAPFIYDWKNTANNTTVSNMQNPANLPGGTFSLIVSDAGGCTATLSPNVTIATPPSALTVAVGQTTSVTCPGGNDGSITLNASGGWGGATVAWTPAIPGGGLNPTGLTGGVYTAIVSDQGGCKDTLDPITIATPPAFTTAPVTVTDVMPCAGDANGSVGITPGGGNGGPYQVQWPGGRSGAQITGLSGGFYAPTITDSKGCTSVLPALEVFEPNPIRLDSATITDKSGNQNNGAIQVYFSGGIFPLGYVWDGPGTFSSTNQNISGLDAGEYGLTVTDAFGCVFDTSFIVRADIGVAVDSVKNACGNDGCIFMTMSPSSVPPFTVTWVGGSGPQIFNTRDIELCGLSAGLYNITIADNNGNAIQVPTQQVQALQPAVVSSMETNPNDDFKNGSILLTGVPTTSAYQFVWNDGFMGNARINLDSGTYCVTITNLSSGCTMTNCYKLTRTYPPFTYFAQKVNPDCANTENGSITLSISGGDGPNYTFQWTGPNGFMATTRNISNLIPGTYTVTITDESMVQRVFVETLTPNSTLAVSNVNETSNYNGFQVSGATMCDGAATAVITGQMGNVSVTWSNGVSGLSNTTLCAGTYSVTVTDGLGCQAVWVDSLTAPGPLAPLTQAVSDFGGFNVSCNGECDGIMSVRVNGGVAPYTVRWPNGEVDVLSNSSQFSTAMNLCGGELLVTVTDGNNVVTVHEVEVLEPAPLTASFSAITPTRFTSCDGELLLSSPGAVGDLTATWSSNNGQQGQGPRASGLCAGEVVFFAAEDENGCTLVANDTVPYPDDGCLLVRPVITPAEQDGNNDFMLITCIESAPDNTVEIYNRYGQLVLPVIESYHNANNNWQGRSGVNNNGAPLPEGVYYYILTYTDDEGNRQQKKGYVNLLR
ncbi:MAG: cohesin domain-containing protein [Saprospiraceae bacterium]|nr:cohesin domain-containing protein [Saprospiraceae bacterium]